MTEPVFSAEPTNGITSEHGLAASTGAASDIAGKTAIDNILTAGGGVRRFGAVAGYGLAALGLLLGILLLMSEAASVSSARSVLLALTVLLAACVVGWGIAAFSRLVAVAFAEQHAQAARLAERFSIDTKEGLALLERIATALEKHGASIPAAMDAAGAYERARSLAEIERAINDGNWAEAETLLGEFESSFSDDPRRTVLREQLASARRGVIEQARAQLAAAREVNDPNRVLELHETLAAVLEEHERLALDQEIARWFISLIHRRLRTGKVQADLVQLAARFSESFGATVEGASVRASLPTLRRSVGLCPRCAQPYLGVADACPNCMKAVSQALSYAPPNDHEGWEPDAPV